MSAHTSTAEIFELSELHEADLLRRAEKITLKLPTPLAEVVFRHHHRAPARHLGESFHAAHEQARQRITALDFPQEITCQRGQRIAGRMIPRNMEKNILADEARAWNHSALAGALWENGFRASRAIAMAENFAAHDKKPCAE